MVIRLDKMLAHYGLGTRKEVKAIVKNKRIKVNGKLVKKADIKIDIDKDEVLFDDMIIKYEPYIYLMLNKPAGYICATEDQFHKTVLDLIDGYENYELFPVGRLDKDTEGLLLISNDGDFAHRLMSPKRHHPKLYYALINGFVNDEDIERFKEGIVIDDYKCKPADLIVLKNDENESEVYIRIYEGKFHQIKKMVKAIHKEVLYLKRTQIKTLKLDDSLKPGQYRKLSDDELFDLKQDL